MPINMQIYSRHKRWLLVRQIIVTLPPDNYSLFKHGSAQGILSAQPTQEWPHHGQMAIAYNWDCSITNWADTESAQTSGAECVCTHWARAAAGQRRPVTRPSPAVPGGWSRTREDSCWRAPAWTPRCCPAPDTTETSQPTPQCLLRTRRMATYDATSAAMLYKIGKTVKNQYMV